MRRLVGLKTAQLSLLFAIITGLALLVAPLAAQAAEYADVLNNVVDKVSSGLAALTEAMSNAAPKAWELIVLGNWTDAAVGIAMSSVLFILFFPTLAIGIVSARFGVQHDREGFIITGSMLCIASVVLLLASVICLGANLAMFLQPEAMTARDFLFDAIGRRH